MENCKINHLGKFRNGAQKFWCSTHLAFASTIEENQIPLRCTRFDTPPIAETEKYELDPEEWDGGVALWGSLDPVYNTSTHPGHQPGIHLHARMEETGDKQIDRTFAVIEVKSPESDLFARKTITIDTEIAQSYTASMVFGKSMKYLECPHCGKAHIDSHVFAVTYHRKHMCTYCGRDFVDTERSIANPVVEIQRVFKSTFNDRTIKIVDRVLDIKQADYPGGIQIWGSNPAIIWTAKRQEESGIHVHVFKDKDGHEALEDETFGRVIIDGIELKGQEVRFLMVQQSLPYLAGKVISIYCPKCNAEHCDRGDTAVIPHEHHVCEFCTNEFTSETKCVGNPVVDKLRQLKIIYDALQK